MSCKSNLIGHFQTLVSQLGAIYNRWPLGNNLYKAYFRIWQILSRVFLKIHEQITICTFNYYLENKVKIDFNKNVNSKPTKTTRDNFFAFEISTKVLNLTRTFNLFDCFFVLESKLVFKSTLKKRNSSTGSTVICFPGRSSQSKTKPATLFQQPKSHKTSKTFLKICTVYLLYVMLENMYCVCMLCIHEFLFCSDDI